MAEDSVEDGTASSGDVVDDGEVVSTDAVEALVPVTPDEHDESARIARLHAAGLLTDEEFEASHNRGKAQLPHREQ